MTSSGIEGVPPPPDEAGAAGGRAGSGLVATNAALQMTGAVFAGGMAFAVGSTAIWSWQSLPPESPALPNASS